MSHKDCSSGKQRYTKTVADQIAINHNKDNDYRLRVYHCQECGWWHLTSHYHKPVVTRRQRAAVA